MLEQCNGITKSGARCKITRNLVNGYCRLHMNQSDRLEDPVIAEESVATTKESIVNEEPVIVKDSKEPDLPSPDFHCRKENPGKTLKLLFCTLTLVACILLVKNLKRFIHR